MEAVHNRMSMEIMQYWCWELFSTKAIGDCYTVPLYKGKREGTESKDHRYINLLSVVGKIMRGPKQVVNNEQGNDSKHRGLCE